MNDADFYEIDNREEQFQFLLQYVDASLFRVTAAGIEVIDGADPAKVYQAIADLRIAAAHFGFESMVYYGEKILVMLDETCAPPHELSAQFPDLVKRRFKSSAHAGLFATSHELASQSR